MELRARAVRLNRVIAQTQREAVGQVCGEGTANWGGGTEHHGSIADVTTGPDPPL